MGKTNKRRKLERNPDYQRLLRYRERCKRLEEQEADAFKRWDVSALNIARGLLYNVRVQIKALEGMLELQSKEPVG